MKGVLGSDPLRICIVARVTNLHQIGGMQQHTDDLARGLATRGHDVTLLTARLPAGVEPPEGRGYSWAIADAESPPYPYRREWGRASARLFGDLHAEHPFDVVHSEALAALGLIKAGFGPVIPLAVLFHGSYLGHARNELRAGWQRRHPVDGIARGVWRAARQLRKNLPGGHHHVFRPFECMVPARQQLSETRLSYRLDPERLHVVPNGIDTDAFSPGESDARAEWGVPDGATVLFSLGRLARDKATDRSILALNVLPDEFVLVIAGEDGGSGEEALLRDLVEREGLADRVRFVGAIAQDRVPDAMRSAGVFVFPTVRDEAAPLVVPQAMACGLPVVASRIGGIPDYLGRREEAGLLIDPGSPEQLAAAVLRLSGDQPLRERLVASARERAVAQFSIAAMSERTELVYRIAMARHALAGSVRSAPLPDWRKL